MVYLPQEIGRWEETEKVHKEKMQAPEEEQVKEEYVLYCKERGTIRRMVGKVCPQCNQTFSANAERCPKHHILMIPIWGEEEPFLDAS